MRRVVLFAMAVVVASACSSESVRSPAQPESISLPLRVTTAQHAGDALGDSLYEAVIYIRGKVKSLGIDCVPGEWTDADTELIERKFRIYGLGSPPEFQKFVCGKVLYNYDNLEPSERKLVIH
jgi:hypothetical protein